MSNKKESRYQLTFLGKIVFIGLIISPIVYYADSIYQEHQHHTNINESLHNMQIRQEQYMKEMGNLKN